MQQPNTIVLYEERLVSLWARLVRTLGIHTARVLLERAIGQTAQRHPDIALLQHDDGGLTFEALETRYATRPHEEIEPRSPTCPPNCASSWRAFSDKSWLLTTTRVLVISWPWLCLP